MTHFGLALAGLSLIHLALSNPIFSAAAEQNFLAAGPRARVNPPKLEVVRGARAAFISQSTGDADIPIVRHQWSGPGGQRSNERRFIVDTSDLPPNDYVINLTVTDQLQRRDRATATLVVKPRPQDHVGGSGPIARIIPRDRTVTWGEIVEFTARRSSDGGGRIRTYAWSINGQTIKDANANITRIDTADLSPGTYTIRVEVTDQQGMRSSDSGQLVVTNRRRGPDLALSELAITPERAAAKREVQFKAVVTNQGEAPALNFKVRFTVGNSTLSEATVAALAPRESREIVATWIAASAGEQTVSVVVDPDNHLQETNRSNNRRTRALLVGESATIRITPDPLQISAGDIAKFTSQVTLPSGQSAANLRYLWRGPGNEKGDSATFQVDTQKLPLGKHGVTLEVTDERNVKYTANASLVITEKPAQLRISAEPSAAQTGQTIKFIGEAKPAAAGTEFKFVFGDGKESAWSANAATSHDYDKPGNYAVKLLARRGDRAIGETSTKVRVTEVSYTLTLTTAPPAIAVGNPVSLTANLEPAGDKVEYQFRFGNGLQTEWLAAASATHVYATVGTYGPSVAARVRGVRVIESNVVTIIVADKKTSPWVWGGIGAVIAAIMAAIGYKLKQR